MRTMVLFEPVCASGEHAQVNAALIAAVLEITDRVVFFAERRHADSVQALLPGTASTRVQWRQLTVPPRQTYGVTERFTTEWRNVREVCRAADETGATGVLATGSTMATVFALRLRSVRAPGRPIGVVFHSLLDHVLSGRRGRAMLRWGNPSALRFIVLGHQLKEAVESVMPGLAGRLFAISLPYLFTDAPRQAAALNPNRLTFAFLGNATLSKGFADFLTLAEQARAERARFELIGALRGECRQFSPRIESQVAAGRLVADLERDWLTVETYRDRLCESSYAVFPYRAADYRFVASAAALDAVWAAKPIIALRVGLFQELFERLGDIGHLCADVDEMRATIEALSSNPPVERYRAQSEALLRGRRVFEPDAVGAELRTALGLHRASAERAPVLETSRQR